MEPEKRTRGLPAVADGRERRKGFSFLSGRVLLWIAIILAAWAIIYWKYTQEKIEKARNALLARQRDAAAELGPRFLPLRDKLERWILEAAGPWQSDQIAPDAKDAPFQTKPSVYLRILAEEATDTKTIRGAAYGSLRDAFTSCLFRGNNPDPWSGPECSFNRDCGQSLTCNETHHCTVSAQPFNLRVFYRGSRMLTDDWIKEVRDASDDMRIRLLDHDLDITVKEDVPAAIDVLARAQYFLLVLDEKPADLTVVPDAGTPMESLQTVAHPARVFVWDIAHDKLLLRIRTDAAAQLTGPSTDAKTTLAIKRQANSCALAVGVRKALGDQDAP
jgi:hypothetical protein